MSETEATISYVPSNTISEAIKLDSSSLFYWLDLRDTRIPSRIGRSEVSN